MKKKIFLALASITLSSLLISCQKWDDPEPISEGYRPIYADAVTVKQIKNLPPRAIKNPGKIYYKDQMLFINESGKGIHVLDNSDPSAPVHMTFIRIRGNSDIAIQGDLMYADNARDFVTIDISDLRNVKVVNRITDVFPVLRYPNVRNVAFECVDETKGVLIGWELAHLDNPQCYR